MVCIGPPLGPAIQDIRSACPIDYTPASAEDKSHENSGNRTLPSPPSGHIRCPHPTGSARTPITGCATTSGPIPRCWPISTRRTPTMRCIWRRSSRSRTGSTRKSSGASNRTIPRSLTAKNGYWYYIRFEPAKEHPIYARRKGALDAAEEIMLDANELASGHDYYQIGELDVSPDAEWLAFCEDTVGRRQYTLRFKNLRSGALTPAVVRDIEPDVAWANDNRNAALHRKGPRNAARAARQETCPRVRPRHRRAGIRANRPCRSTRASRSRSPTGSYSFTARAPCPRSGGTRTRMIPRSRSRYFFPENAATNTRSNTCTTISSCARIGRLATFG